MVRARALIPEQAALPQARRRSKIQECRGWDEEQGSGHRAAEVEQPIIIAGRRPTNMFSIICSVTPACDNSQ